MRLANFTAVKEEPVDDASQQLLDQQCKNENQTLTQYNSDGMASNVLLSCSQCDYKCNNNRDLQRHIRAKHTGEYLLRCSESD